MKIAIYIVNHAKLVGWMCCCVGSKRANSPLCLPELKASDGNFRGGRLCAGEVARQHHSGLWFVLPIAILSIEAGQMRCVRSGRAHLHVLEIFPQCHGQNAGLHIDHS
jgi:hypothetical protein